MRPIPLASKTSPEAGLKVVLVSTYDLGHPPFGLASPAAWLEREGAQVTCLDLAVQHFDAGAFAAADLIAFFVPMHTATRLAARAVERVRAINADAHLCFYGLYAPMNEKYLRGLGAQTILGGEYEAGLVHLAQRLRAGESRQSEPAISLERQQFLPPKRDALGDLDHYAHLIVGSDDRLVGYTEASRGCRHRCRHCPIPPVYGGKFRIVQREVVLEDVRRQVAGGARHITFGDPDFFNGPGHSLAIVRALHAEFPEVTYDVTIKVEHLLRHDRHLSTLRDTGCLFVTTAVEALDDDILAKLHKGHTTAEFERVVERFHSFGLVLNPTFVAFTPWTTLRGYRELLAGIARLGLIEHVSSVQLAIRLLIPPGSLLLELPEIAERVGELDEAALVHPWRHPDPLVDRLQAAVQTAVVRSQRAGEDRPQIFARAWELASLAAEGRPRRLPPGRIAPRRKPIPYLTEPWYC